MKDNQLTNQAPNQTEDAATSRIPLHPVVRHHPPKYYGYKGGYDNVCRCQKCGAVGLYDDFHPVNPCTDCGGKVKKAGAAKWRESYTGQVSRRFFGLIVEREVIGRWVFAQP